MAFIEVTDCGLYCSAADLYIDPWKGVNRALITHAHSDHARWGSNLYIAQSNCIPILKARIGAVNTKGVAWNEILSVNGVNISFHPAGHIPGSAQIRLEHKGEVWVVSGDYKTEYDGLCEAFEPVKCHAFISESTFGLPIYQWKPQQEIFDEINQWWRKNKEEGLTSVILAYSLGKSQRILMHADASIGPVISHTAVHNMNEVVRSVYPKLPVSRQWTPDMKQDDYRGALIIAPSSAANSPWIHRFKPFSLGVASGWMNLRGAKRRSAADRGFVLSDHADWQGLNSVIEATGAEKFYITHGYTAAFTKWLTENNRYACELETLFEGEKLDATAEAES